MNGCGTWAGFAVKRDEFAQGGQVVRQRHARRRQIAIDEQIRRKQRLALPVGTHTRPRYVRGQAADCERSARAAFATRSGVENVPCLHKSSSPGTWRH